MKKLLIVLTATLILLSTGNARGKDDDNERLNLFTFHQLSPVTPPFTGPANPIRGVPGAGAPWKITAAKAELDQTGKLEVSVRGLVLVATGANPIANFQAVLNCQTKDPVSGAATTVNVALAAVPATTTGDADMEGHVDLPSPCNGAIVFVVIPATPTAAARWLAVSGF
jgi:hypothetical protein